MYVSTLSNINISETRWPIKIKFHLENHWGGGLTVLGFWARSDRNSGFFGQQIASIGL